MTTTATTTQAALEPLLDYTSHYRLDLVCPVRVWPVIWNWHLASRHPSIRARTAGRTCPRAASTIQHSLPLSPSLSSLSPSRASSRLLSRGLTRPAPSAHCPRPPRSRSGLGFSPGRYHGGPGQPVPRTDLSKARPDATPTPTTTKRNARPCDHRGPSPAATVTPPVAIPDPVSWNTQGFPLAERAD